jgi:hypothetical protein
LADALGVIVGCIGCGVEDSRTDKEVVADFDGNEQARACSARITLRIAKRRRQRGAAPATALRLPLFTTFFKIKRSK